MTTNLVTHDAEDRYGLMIEDQLISNGVDAFVGGSAQTTVATATLDHSGDARYTFDISRDLNGPSLPALSADESSRHLHTGSIATVLSPGCDTAYTLLEAARGHVTISHDPNCRPAISGDVDRTRRDIARFVAASDLVKASDEDLEWLYPDRTRDQTVEAWLELGPAMVAVTCGADGPAIATRRWCGCQPERLRWLMPSWQRFLHGRTPCLARHDEPSRRRGPPNWGISLPRTSEPA